MQGSAMMYAIGPTPAGRISPLRVYAHSFSSGRGAVSWHFLCPAFCAKSSGWIRTFILVVRLPTFPVCPAARAFMRSEEHTSELQSRGHLVCRLLLEKKKKN